MNPTEKTIADATTMVAHPLSLFEQVLEEFVEAAQLGEASHDEGLSICLFEGQRDERMFRDRRMVCRMRTTGYVCVVCEGCEQLMWVLPPGPQGGQPRKYHDHACQQRAYLKRKASADAIACDDTPMCEASSSCPRG